MGRREYYDIIFKISKYNWQKKLEQNCGCSQDISLQSLEVSELNLKCTKKNKKDKPNMNSATKDKMRKWYYSHSSLSFLFLLMHFEFGFENYRDCIDVSFEHLQICSNIFWHLQLIFFLIW
jgi:hypothetical protein